MSKGIIEVKQIIQNHADFVIVSHQSPDGDAVGSSTALARVLSNLNKKVNIILPDRPSNVIENFLVDFPCVFYNENPELGQSIIGQSDVLFALDFNATQRVGDSLKLILESFSGKKIMIDHHQNPDHFADILISDTENSSTCQLLFEMIERLELMHAIDVIAARGFYLGMMTDTGSFRYPSVNKDTHRIVSLLMGYGIRPFEIHEQVFDHQRLEQLQLRGYAIAEKLVLSSQYPFGYITLTEGELQRFNYQSGDTEGLVNVILSIDGIQAALLLTENAGLVKLSFRSKNQCFVNEYANRYFNGGGHRYAAGGRTKMGMADTVSLLLSTYHELFES